jgi:type I restriction enzyme S subunit
MNERWQLPATWQWCAAGDIALVVGGGTPPSGDSSNFAADGTPWITPADLSEYEGTYISRGGRSLSPTGFAICAARLLPPNTVLLSSRAPIGYCVISEAEVATSQGFKSFVLPPGIVPEYLRYYLVGSRDYLDSLASGTTFKELSGARAAEIRVPIAPYGEQRRIVAKLDELMEQSKDVRLMLGSIPDMIQQYREAALISAFRGDLTAKWRSTRDEVEPATQLLARVRVERRNRWEDAELSRLVADGKSPSNDKWKLKYEESDLLTTSQTQIAGLFGDLAGRGWGCSPLESLVDADRGIPYGIVKTGDEVREGVPTIRGGDIKHHRIIRETLKRVAPSIATQFSRTRLRGGEVLLAIRGSVGETAVAGPDLAGCNISREVAMIPVLPGIDANYIALLLTSPAGREMLATHTKGIAQTGINLADLRGLAVPIPPSDEQIEIVRQLSSRFQFAERAEATVREYSAQRVSCEKTGLSEAFRGELVQQDPREEPAEVLMDQVRNGRAAFVKAFEQSAPQRSLMMAKATKEFVVEAIRRLPHETFSMDDLRLAVPGSYDALQEILFDLLDDPSSLVMQKFDSSGKTMRLRRTVE